MEARVLETGAHPGVGARNAPGPATGNGTNIVILLETLFYLDRELDAFGMNMLVTVEGFEEDVMLSLDLLCVWNSWMIPITICSKRKSQHCVTGVLLLDIVSE